MQKRKVFSGLRFTAETIALALKRLGEPSRFETTIALGSETSIEDDQPSRFFSAYEAGQRCSFIAFSKEVGGDRLAFSGSDDGAKVTVAVNAPSEARVDDILGVFEEAARNDKALRIDVPAPIGVARYCALAPLRWKTLPHLANHLASHGVSIDSVKVTLHRFPDVTTYEAWGATLDAIAAHGEPYRYSVRCWGRGPAGRFGLLISRQRYEDTNEPYMEVDISGLPNVKLADEIFDFLGLEAELASTPKKGLQKSAFLAHRFDSNGTQIADRLARFLELLGFDVKTGREFSPEPVGEKVRRRMEAQALVFVVHTAGDDTTWLAQESMLAFAKDKRLFILKETHSIFKSGVLADLEYISFDGTAVELAFIPVLEGLRGLGYFPR